MRKYRVSVGPKISFHDTPRKAMLVAGRGGQVPLQLQHTYEYLLTKGHAVEITTASSSIYVDPIDDTDPYTDVINRIRL